MESNYSIRFKSNSVGYSGSVTISIIKSDFFMLEFNEKITKYGIDDILDQVKTAIQHGINLFFFSNNHLKMDAFLIKIKDIDYNNIDSSLTIMTFVTYNALIDCFNLPKENQLRIDEENGLFLFPR